MSGILFLSSQRLDEIRRFYTERLSFRVWLEQADCVVLQHGNLLLGFCRREKVELGGMSSRNRS